MSLIKIDVDVDGLFDRQLTRIEQDNLPYAAMQAANRTAAEIQYQWNRLIATRLDAPVNLTLKSVFLKKARYTRDSDGTRSTNAAEVFIRDEAAKGTAPARYLFPQVFGGAGHDRGIDRGLRRVGYLGEGEYAIPVADNTLLDGRGNIKNGVVQQILSQLGAQFDALSNESQDAKKLRNRRARGKSIKQARNRRFFAVSRQGKKIGTEGNTGHLSPGVYLRDGKHDLTKVYNFTSRPSMYSARLDLFSAAQKAWNKNYGFFLDRELTKALQESMLRGQA